MLPIGLRFRKAVPNQVRSFLSASLPSQALRASSPKGGAFSRRKTSRYIQNLSLWERWHREAMTERASPLTAAHCVSLDCTYDRAIITPTFRKAQPNQAHSFLSASSPSQALRASSPKGGAFSRRQTFRYIQNLSLWERWHRASDDGEGEPADKNAPRKFRSSLCYCSAIAFSARRPISVRLCSFSKWIFSAAA